MEGLDNVNAQIMGVSPVMLGEQDIDRLVEMMECRRGVGLNGAGMGEDSPSPTAQIPDYVVERMGSIGTSTETQVE